MELLTAFVIFALNLNSDAISSRLANRPRSVLSYSQRVTIEGVNIIKRNDSIRRVYSSSVFSGLCHHPDSLDIQPCLQPPKCFRSQCYIALLRPRIWLKKLHKCIRVNKPNFPEFSFWIITVMLIVIDLSLFQNLLNRRFVSAFRSSKLWISFPKK